MISLHTHTSVSLTELLANGASITHKGDDLYYVLFPARGSVGSIGCWYRSEPTDDLQGVRTHD